MNILKWLKSKSGKLPITLAQAAGITAVVGAAGFGAMTFLSSPEGNTNTFLPPSATQEQVVYVAQSAGGGQYEANGEVGSAFNAAPSRAIQLANQAADRQAQTRALEESSQQAPSFGGSDAASPQTPQAYQLSGADLGQGLGGGKNKQLNSSLDMFSTIQNQLSGVTEAVNQAQAQAGQAQAGKPGAPAADGQNAAKLASAPRNWGNGLTRAGGGNSGSANSFVIQNSGKNARTRGATADEVAQAGDAIAQAQAAMATMQEGTRLRAQANFGRSEGLTEDKDARTRAARRFTGAKKELEFIRKKSAAIASNKTNAANEGGTPFLASTKISGGLTVNGENVTTGQSSSGDLKSNFDKQMKGIQARMDKELATQTEQDLARSDLKSWFWTMFTTSLLAMVSISILVKLAKVVPWPWNLALYAAAGILTLATLFYVWYGSISKITNYNAVCGSDGWSIFGWALSGIVTAGVGLAWIFGPGMVKISTNGLLAGALALVGFGGVGFGINDLLTNDQPEETPDEEGERK